MLVETQDLLTTANAAWTAGIDLRSFQALVLAGRIKAFVTIDGVPFFHRHEAIALRRHHEAMAGHGPSLPAPRVQELF